MSLHTVPYESLDFKDVGSLKHALVNRLIFTIGKDPLETQPRDWFLALVNSHLAPAQPGSPDATWQLSESSFAEMMRALFADVRGQIVARPGELRKRYGDHTVDTVAAFFRRLDSL